MRMKKAYLREEAVPLDSGSGKSVRMKWVEKEKGTFDWGPEQRESFLHTKYSIRSHRSLIFEYNYLPAQLEMLGCRVGVISLTADAFAANTMTMLTQFREEGTSGSK